MGKSSLFLILFRSLFHHFVSRAGGSIALPCYSRPSGWPWGCHTWLVLVCFLVVLPRILSSSTVHRYRPVSHRFASPCLACHCLTLVWGRMRFIGLLACFLPPSSQTWLVVASREGIEIGILTWCCVLKSKQPAWSPSLTTSCATGSRCPLSSVPDPKPCLTPRFAHLTTPNKLKSKLEPEPGACSHGGCGHQLLPIIHLHWNSLSPSIHLFTNSSISCWHSCMDELQARILTCVYSHLSLSLPPQKPPNHSLSTWPVILSVRLSLSLSNPSCSLVLSFPSLIPPSSSPLPTLRRASVAAVAPPPLQRGTDVRTSVPGLPIPFPPPPARPSLSLRLREQGTYLPVPPRTVVPLVAACSSAPSPLHSPRSGLYPFPYPDPYRASTPPPPPRLAICLPTSSLPSYPNIDRWCPFSVVPASLLVFSCFLLAGTLFLKLPGFGLPTNPTFS